MRQTTFATTAFDRYAKTTRKAAFLAEMDKISQIKRYTEESAAHGWAASLYVRFLYCRLRVTNCEPAIADLEAAVEQDQLESMFDTAVFALMGDTPQVRQRYNFALPADTARALTLLRSAATPKSGATNRLPFTVYSNQAAGMLAYLYGGGSIGGAAHRCAGSAARIHV